MPKTAAHIYYFFKPFLPRWLQIKVRRQIVIRKQCLYTDIWPIDEQANKPPQDWSGWPNGKKFALVLTHDVDTSRGQERCYDLATLENELGFRSSFNFVPKRYIVSSEVRQYLTSHGFEVGVHGLCHDGNLYKSREIFLRRAEEINRFSVTPRLKQGNNGLTFTIAYFR